MTLPASGAITSTQIKTEMGLGAADLVVPDTDTLWLAGKASGSIVWPDDFWSKTWGPTFSIQERFGADASPGSTWTIPSSPGFAVGDLVVVCQYAESTTAAIPASVIPAGWTQIGSSITGTTSAGTGYRVNTSYRVVTAGQLGSVVTGMDGTGRNRICAAIYHFDRAIAGVTIVDSGAASNTIAAGAQVMDWDSIRDGTHFFIGHCHGETEVADAEFTCSVALGAEEQGGASTTRTYYKPYANTAPPASITFNNVTDNGEFNVVQGTLLRLT